MIASREILSSFRPGDSHQLFELLLQRRAQHLVYFVVRKLLSLEHLADIPNRKVLAGFRQLKRSFNDSRRIAHEYAPAHPTYRPIFLCLRWSRRLRFNENSVCEFPKRLASTFIVISVGIMVVGVLRAASRVDKRQDALALAIVRAHQPEGAVRRLRY